MSSIYLTPASISFLTQFILSLAITLFLIRRLRNGTTQLILLVGFFFNATIFIGLMFLDAALSPYPRLLAVYSENTVLALALVFLIQFAYRFPQYNAHRKWEAFASLMVSLAYFLWEGGFMVYRYISLLGLETVYYRPIFSAYANALVLLWAPVVFLRQSITADTRSVSWLKKIWRPQGKGARGARAFVVVFGILFVLGIINLLRDFKLPTTVYNAALSIGILVALWLFAINYINFIPGGVSVHSKISILTLTLFLAMLGSVGWMIAPAYIETYRPNLADHQTLRFTPNTSGEYEVSLVDVYFETVLGDKLPVQSDINNNQYKIDFTFPFYGQNFREIYVASSGVISMGQPFWQPNMQARYANLPMIIPLMIELDANAGGGLYALVEPGRLVLTWDHLPALYNSDAIFTFQAVLYQDGVFDITYNGLPLPYRFDPDASPSANPWMRGMVSGHKESLHTGSKNLLAPITSNHSPLIENYQLDFRRYLHDFILPLAWVIIGGSLLLLLILPWLLRLSIIRPLEALSSGVRQMQGGHFNVEVPIQHEDEIGYLARAFNSMAARLGELVTDLEQRVSERTTELADANKRLQRQLAEIETLQAELVEQAIRDPLTNTFNRRYLLETLERELSRAEREGYPLSLVMIDLDNFKQFNDEFGHQAGDLLLQRLAGLLMDNTRKGDAVCRYGGDEFVALMPNISLQEAHRRAEEWRLACESLQRDGAGKSITVTLSQGVVAYLDPKTSAEELLHLADQALYQAKAAGRNCTAIYEPSNSGNHVTG
ncbi:MAG: diguanylate cyclase [Anaerolineales bacterium]|nr:diguanylate cyclase [Anaerolineales bacterium]